MTPGGCHDVSVEGMKRLYRRLPPEHDPVGHHRSGEPPRIHDQQYPGITGWHSAAMSWNGEFLYAGWEPGGGSAPRCQATGSPLSTPPVVGNVQTDAMKTIFVFRASNGALVGRWVLPQEQYRSRTARSTTTTSRRIPTATSSCRATTRRGWPSWTSPTRRAPTQVAFSDPASDRQRSGDAGASDRAGRRVVTAGGTTSSSRRTSGRHQHLAPHRLMVETKTSPVHEPADDDQSAYLPSHAPRAARSGRGRGGPSARRFA